MAGERGRQRCKRSDPCTGACGRLRCGSRRPSEFSFRALTTLFDQIRGVLSTADLIEKG